MSQQHLVSIVICTYNRMQYLPRCLEHLKNQQASPSDYEIVLINNNSTDKTESICKDYILDNPELNVFYFLEKQPGLSHARNRGVKEAKGDVVCFIDDDGFAIPNYVSIIKKASLEPKYFSYMAFGGKVNPCYNEGKEPVWISKYISGLVSEVDLGKNIKTFDKKYPAGCNMIFRKEFFEKHGGFNVDLHTRGDDKYIFEKLKSFNYNILYIPDLEVSHFIDDYRLEKGFIIRLSKIIGQSEAIRLKDKSLFVKFNKLIEYVFKLMAAFVLAVFFLFKRKTLKAKYIVMVRWNVVLGYFIKEKI